MILDRSSKYQGTLSNSRLNSVMLHLEVEDWVLFLALIYGQNLASLFD